MDMYKLKWKMKFRLKQLKGFFKLCEYKFRHKFHLEGDDQFYYHLQRRLMEDLVKADPEREYLEEHGLLPEEPEPEEAPQPEPEKEPGLLRTLDFMDLVPYPVTVGSDTFCLTVVKEYEDRTTLTMQIVDANYDVRDATCIVPHEAGRRFDTFTLEGNDWRWDRVDGRLRFCPLVQETEGDLAAAKPVRMVLGLVLRVDKALAEEKLSAACLEYAFDCTDAGYDWCVEDRSYCTAAYELKLAADVESEKEILEGLQRYCYHYWKENVFVKKESFKTE